MQPRLVFIISILKFFNLPGSRFDFFGARTFQLILRRGNWKSLVFIVISLNVSLNQIDLVCRLVIVVAAENRLVVAIKEGIIINVIQRIADIIVV